MLSEPEIVSLLSFSALLLIYMMTFLKPEKEDEEWALLVEQTPLIPNQAKKKLKIDPYLPFMSPIMHSPFYYTGETSHRMICLHLDA
jgi:hypothetical protein